MVCVPIDTDQPIVAYRVSDELGVAVRLNLLTLNADDVRNAMHQIFDDKQYYVRADRLSQISRTNPGQLSGAKFILELLEEL